MGDERNSAYLVKFGKKVHMYPTAELLRVVSVEKKRKFHVKDQVQVIERSQHIPAGTKGTVTERTAKSYNVRFENLRTQRIMDSADMRHANARRRLASRPNVIDKL